MAPLVPEVAEDLRVPTARLFQGVRQDAHVLEASQFVDGFGYADHDPVLPLEHRGVQVRQWPERESAEDVAEQCGVRCEFSSPLATEGGRLTDHSRLTVLGSCGDEAPAGVRSRRCCGV